MAGTIRRAGLWGAGLMVAGVVCTACGSGSSDPAESALPDAAQSDGGADVGAGGDGSADALADVVKKDGSGVDADATDGAAGKDAAADAPGEVGVDAPSGKLLFVGDFDTGDLSQWDYVQECEKGKRITVYSKSTLPAGAPAPRGGTHAVRFHVLDTDVAPCTSTDNPRAQLQSVLDLLKPGDEVWEAWSVFVPSSFPGMVCQSASCSGTWMVLQQDYGPPWNGSPSIGWDLNRVANTDVFVMARGAQYGHDTPWSTSLVKNKWVDFLVHKKMANTASGGGFVEAWFDKQPITFSKCNCTKLSMQTMHSDQASVGFFLTSYRAKGLLDVADIYFDEARVGTTREIVEQP